MFRICVEITIVYNNKNAFNCVCHDKSSNHIHSAVVIIDRSLILLSIIRSIYSVRTSKLKHRQQISKGKSYLQPFELLWKKSTDEYMYLAHERKKCSGTIVLFVAVSHKTRKDFFD